MPEPDLAFRRTLQGIAADIPAPKSVRAAVQSGYRRGLRRRRAMAIGSAVAVVLVIAGATTILSTGAGSTSQQAHPPAPLAATSDTAAKAGVVPTRGVTAPGRTATGHASSAEPTTSSRSTTSHSTASSRSTSSHSTSSGSTARPVPDLSPFVAAPAPDLSSPVSVPSAWTSYDPGGPSIHAGGGYLAASWISSDFTVTANAAGDSDGYTGHNRGYLVTDGKPALTVAVLGPGLGLHPGQGQAVSHAITVNGHAAQYLTAPGESYEPTYHSPATARIAWQLPNRRWIQVWAQGDDEKTLTSFAGAITDQPTRFPESLSLGLTLPGVTNTIVMFAPGEPPNVSVCSVPEDAFGLNRAHASCVWASASHKSFAEAFTDVGLDAPHTQEQIGAATTVITLDGRSITVNTLLQIGLYTSGQLTVEVHVPTAAKLTARELATLANTVRAPADLSIDDGSTPTTPAVPTGHS